MLKCQQMIVGIYEQDKFCYSNGIQSVAQQNYPFFCLVSFIFYNPVTEGYYPIFFCKGVTLPAIEA